MRTLLLAAALSAIAVPALAQPAPIPRDVSEPAGCAAVYLTMARLASDPSMVGDDPLAGALGSAFGRSWQIKGRALHARAAEAARRRGLPPEVAFEAGVNDLIDAYAAARARSGGGVDLAVEAARLVERCVTAFPDEAADY